MKLGFLFPDAIPSPLAKLKMNLLFFIILILDLGATTDDEEVLLLCLGHEVQGNKSGPSSSKHTLNSLWNVSEPKILKDLIH